MASKIDVTRKHRELAWKARWTAIQRDEYTPAWASHWVETGELIGGGNRELENIALALARLEAQTARRCWREGYIGRVDEATPDSCGEFPIILNPYPPLDEADDG